MFNPIRKYLLNNVLRAPDDGAGGSGSGDGAGGGGKSESLAAAAAAAQQGGEGQQQQQGSDGQQQQNANGAQLPEWAPQGLPAHMVGKDECETIDKLFKSWDGYHRANSQRGAVPQDITGYKFEPTDALKPYADGLGEDELYTGFLADFREGGMTDKQFAVIMPKILERVLATGNIAAPVDFNEHLNKLVPESARTLDEQGQRQAAGKRVADALAFVDGIKAQKGIPDEVADYLVAQLGDDPKGIQALEFMQSLGNKAGPALGGQGGGGSTDADLDARLTDPRGDPDSPQFDRGFVAETDRLFQQRYGK